MENNNNSKIVCLCGSTKFKREFENINALYTLNGYIVLMPGVFGHFDNIEITPENKSQLIELHKRKIDLADEVYIINVNGYIGDSTNAEIEYARSKNKPIYFYNNPNFVVDELGGIHDGDDGYNPNGFYCGKCEEFSCVGCPLIELDYNWVNIKGSSV